MSNCPYCCWIDPEQLEADEVDGPMNYCRVCGRKLQEDEQVREAVLECYWPDGTSETRRVKVTDGFMKALRYWTELEEEEKK